MVLYIYKITVSSWETLILSIPKAGLLRNVGMTLQQIKICWHQDNNSIVNHLVDEIILQYNKELSAEAEAQ